jgi:hypothetical protein
MIKDYIFSQQGSLIGSRDVIGFGDERFEIKEIDRNLANKTIIKNHYSHKVYTATYIHLGIFFEEKMLGVLQYGYAMNPASQKSVVADTEMDEYLELNRMWLDDSLPKNSESKAISYSIKYIKRKYNNKIKWIQSFADERCGKNGIVYQACSFDYYGEHKSDFWELDGVVYHNIQMTLTEKDHRYNDVIKNLQENKDKAKRMNLRQFRYIFFIDQRYKNKCLLEREEYPKHYEENL